MSEGKGKIISHGYWKNMYVSSYPHVFGKFNGRDCAPFKPPQRACAFHFALSTHKFLNRSDLHADQSTRAQEFIAPRGLVGYGVRLLFHTTSEDREFKSLRGSLFLC